MLYSAIVYKESPLDHQCFINDGGRSASRLILYTSSALSETFMSLKNW